MNRDFAHSTLQIFTSSGASISSAGQDVRGKNLQWAFIGAMLIALALGLAGCVYPQGIPIGNGNNTTPITNLYPEIKTIERLPKSVLSPIGDKVGFDGWGTDCEVRRREYAGLGREQRSK